MDTEQHETSSESTSPPTPETISPLAPPESGEAPASFAKLTSLLDELSRDVHDTAVSELRLAAADAERVLLESLAQSRSLAEAQAHALARSAESIEELERTRLELHHARREAEQAAQLTASLANAIFERNRDAILVLKDDRCVSCNGHALRLMAVDASSLIGQWPHWLLGKAEEPDPLGAAYRLATSLGVARQEAIRHRATGEPFWCELSANTFEMNGDTHVLLLVRDISARKAMESEIRRSREFLNKVINAVPDQLYVKSEDDQLLLVNEALCETLRVAPKQLLGRSAGEVLPRQIARVWRDAEEMVLRDEAPRHDNEQWTDAIGRQRTFSVKRSLFHGDATDERFLVATSRDITDDRAKEARLRLLASVFDNAQEGVAILSAEGLVLEANPAFLKIAGQPASTIIGRGLNAAFKLSVEPIDQALPQVLRGAHWAGKILLPGAPTRRRSFRVSLSPVMNLDQPPCVVALFSDVTEIDQTQQRLRQQALHDNVTGLPNRRYFRDRIREFITQAASRGTPFAVFFLDLDDFKHVNDSLGHKSGDVLLTYVAKRLLNCAGPDAFVARFGGDEFAVLTPHVDADRTSIIDLADRITRELRRPFRLNETESYIGVSIGVTIYPDDATDADSLLRNADVAMYAAKEMGKNQLRLFSGDMRISVETRHLIHNQLRQALQDDEITLVYQPQVWAANQQLAGCEALARWRNKLGDSVAPNAFVPIAEQTGLIIPLGDLVLKAVCRQAVAWRGLPGRPPRIAANLAPQQIRHPKFLAKFEELLQETGALPEEIELEITENAVMEDVKHAGQIMAYLADLGVSVAIDDFGTGHSSLSFLKSFRIHTLKIDRSFVRDVPHDETAAAIVHSIISLGRGRGMTVVAEGVETQEQSQFLMDLGCHVLQGYLVGRPAPKDAFETWCGQRLH